MPQDFSSLIAEMPKPANLKNEIEKLLEQEPGYRCSDDLATLLTNLRAEQKGFFAAKPGTLQRQNHLHESKRLEKELDKFLQERKAPVSAPDLFS